MDNTPWLTIIGAIPAVGALVLMLLPAGLIKSSRQIGMLITLATAGAAFAALGSFSMARSNEVQLVEQHSWIPQFGVSYALGVNGIGLMMILLSVVLVPLCLLAMWDVVEERELGVAVKRRNFIALLLLLEAMMIGVFAARDVFLFYVFFEAMLIPSYFLIASYGGKKAKPAAVKFLLFSLAGGLIMLAAVIALYLQGPGGPQGFLIDNLTPANRENPLYSSGTMESLLFFGFFIAFAVKAPMWPLHTWLPDATEEAPPGVSVLLVGVLDKVGTFGMMTLCLVLFPEASKAAAPYIVVWALLSMIFGAFGAIGSKDIHRLIAYTSISHFGFIVMGIFAMTSQAQVGAMLYMLNHGFSTAALFLVAGMLVKRRGSQKIADFGGWQRLTPWLAGSFLLAGLSSLALPGMSSFVSEFLVLLGTFERYRWATIIGAFGVVLSAIYILNTYRKMMTGPAPEDKAPKDISGREAAVIVPIIAVILALGFYPAPALKLLNPVIKHTMNVTGVEDVTPVAEGGKG